MRASFDGASLHTVLHGAAPISPRVKAQMIEWWGPVLVEYWGTSEAGVFTLVGSQDWLDRPGTVGRAVPHYEVFAVGDDGAVLPAGEVGTLYCRHRRQQQVFEYHGAPDKTAAAHLEPGVFTMGDIGRVDADGFVHLADRSANVIISGGVNIYPAEIEHVLAEHPAVADVAVFGIPDDEWGEQVKAAVELAPRRRGLGRARGRDPGLRPRPGWRATRCPARSTSRTSSRATRPGSCTPACCATGTGRAGATGVTARVAR